MLQTILNKIFGEIFWFKTLMTVLLIAPITVCVLPDKALAVDREINKSFHLVWRRESPVKIRDTITVLSRNGYSKLYIGLTKSICLEFEYWDCSSADWSTSDLSEIIDFAHRNGISVGLEIKMLSKMKKSFGHLNEALYNTETLNPDLDIVGSIYETTFEYVSRTFMVSDLIIGFDEIFGFSAKGRKKLIAMEEKMLPADLFVRGLKIADNLSKKYKLPIAIWGDMLFDNELLVCEGSRHHHGSAGSGYGQSILVKMPPNVKVIAWYYDGPAPVCALDELRAVGAPIGFAVYKKKSVSKFKY